MMPVCGFLYIINIYHQYTEACFDANELIRIHSENMYV